MGPQQGNMLIRRFGSGIYHESWVFLPCKTSRVQNTQSYVLRGKSKFFNVFHNEQSETKQHGRTQMPWPPAIQVLGRDEGRWGSSCCFPRWGPKADVWAMHGRWMPVLPANDTEAMSFHCLLVEIAIFLYNSVIIGYRNWLRRPVVMAPNWDIGDPDLVLPNEAENGFE